MSTLRDDLASKCVYFNGLQREYCKRGVRYHDVRDTSTSPVSVPCLTRLNEAGATCDLAKFPSDEQLDEMVAEIDTELEEFNAKVQAGICHVCDTPITSETQVGRCVYAAPCGCRLWQGKARTREQLAQLRKEAV